MKQTFDASSRTRHTAQTQYPTLCIIYSLNDKKNTFFVNKVYSGHRLTVFMTAPGESLWQLFIDPLATHLNLDASQMTAWETIAPC